MSNKQQHDSYDDGYKEIDLGAGLDHGFDLIFKNSKAINKKPKEKSQKNARRRVEDYMEQKAFKEKMKDWDNSFDL